MGYEARIKVMEEAKARMATLSPGDPVTNVCAGDGNPHCHAFFSKMVVKQYKNKYGHVMSDYYARCHLKKGKSWNTAIEAIFPGHLSTEESKKIFAPIWEAFHT